MTEKNPNGLQDGGRIRKLRKERLGDPSGDALAARVGIYRQSLTNIEANKKAVSLALIVKIARELKEPIEGLLRKDASADEDEPVAA
jgi:DNA-binding XRE family transcriptional regulator